MAEHGWCNLPGFLHAAGLAKLRDEAASLLPQARGLTIRRTIYQTGADENASCDPRQRAVEHTALQLADDQIPQDTGIRRLYHSALLTDFVRVVQGKAVLYRCADRFQALNIVTLPPGSWHGWHYDNNECTVTLLLQAAEQGGAFMFLPDSRGQNGEDADRVTRLLNGDLSVASTFERDAGALTLFRGGNSLHGVTTVDGMRPRMTAIFTYSERPDETYPDEMNIRIYGERAAEILKAGRA